MSSGLDAPLRILVVSPFPPRLDSTHGGGRSIASLLEHLSRRHEVALAFFRGHGEAPLDPVFRDLCVAVLELERPWTGRRMAVGVGKRLRLLAGLLRARPSWVTRWWSPPAARRLARFAQSWRPDIVQLEFHVMAQYASLLRRAASAVVLVVHEPGFDTAAEARTHSRGVRRVLARLEERGWLRFERKALRCVDAAVAFTPDDRAALERLDAGTPIHVIPLGVRVHPASSTIGEGNEPRLLLVGNFVHPPNVDAAEWLVRGILPRVRERVRGVVIELVGPDPEGALRPLTGGAVRTVGEVQDLEPYVDSATVVVLPLRRGGGMRVKTLEALAAGKAIVATPLAVAGLAVEHDVHVRVAETTEAFADEVISLLGAPGDREELGRRARQWASANLAWDGVADRYEALYAALLEDLGAGDRSAGGSTP